MIGVSAVPYSHAHALDDSALPSGGQVTNGSASFDYSAPNELHINQSSDRVTINWNSFNIGKNALTQFHQSGANAIAVNKVTGSFEPTQILGTLKANGQIVILDQNGVIFGDGSRVDVGGIIASTGTIDDTAFMTGAGVLEITDINNGGTIVNDGHITVAEAGLAAFVAPSVINNGVIEAKLGTITLASGTAATIDLYGDGLVEVAANAPLQEALIDNTGSMIAEGGTVKMTAAAAQGVVNNVINTSGIINVASATQKGGKIILEGPSIEVSGTLDASGDTGGGTIHVGGGWQGKDESVNNAKNVTVTSSAALKANTTGDHGDGGEVVLWADGNTQFDGTIEAKGGALSGDGGKVETSGKINLGVTGSVNATANNDTGKAGEWLLDPQNVRITNSGNSIPGGGGIVDPTGTANPYLILASSISAALSAGNNVTITTVNAGQAQTGHIELNNATILKSGGGDATLTLKADGAITTAGTNSITSNTGKLNTIFWADADNTGDSSDRLAVQIYNTTLNTNGGDLHIGGGLDDGSAILDAFGDVLYQGIAADGRPDGFAIAAAAAPGNGSPGVNIQSSTIDTGSGKINIFGRSGTTDQWSYGVRLFGSSISSDGNIVIGGEGGAAGAWSSTGIQIESSSSITARNNGTVTLSGKGLSSTNNNANGIAIGTGNNVSAHNGALTLIGKSGTSAAGTRSGIAAWGGGILSDGSALITIKGEGGGAHPDIVITNTVGGASATGDQVYIANSVNFDTASVLRTTGKITIKPRTASQNINVGLTGTGLNLTDAYLSRITAGTLVIGDSALGTGDIIVDSWDLSGKSYNVELYGNDITFNDTDATAGVDYAVRLGTGNFMAHAKDNDGGADPADIIINAAIQKQVAGTSLLDLRADSHIYLLSSNITATTGSLNTLFNSDRDADSEGGIIVSSSAITTNGGYLVMGGGSGTVGGVDGILGNGDGTGADDVAAIRTNTTGHGIHLTSSTISTGAGDIFLTGAGGTAGGGSYGIYQTSGSPSITTTSGNITLKGSARHASNSHAINLTGSIQSGSGDITLSGTGSPGMGIVLWNNIDIATQQGDLTLTGTGSSADIYINNTGTAMKLGSATSTGDITLKMNDYYFGAAAHTITTQGRVILMPYTSSASIGVSGGSGTLGLLDNILSTITAATMVIGDSVNGTGDITVDSWDLSGKTHNVQVHGKDITLAGITMGSGDVTLYSKGTNGITVSADSLSNASGDLTLLATGPVRINQRLENAGTGHINLFAGWDGSSGITTPALFDLDDIDFGGIIRNVTIGANGTIHSAGTNTAVLIASTGNLLNNATAGANAIQTSAGRYLIYGDHPDDTTKGGLTAKNLYNRTYVDDLPSTITGGSRFIFAHQPTITLAANNITTTDPSTAVYSFGASSGLRSDDLLADAITGTPTYSLGALSGNTRPIVMGLGTLASPMGYAITLANGAMTISSLQPTTTTPTTVSQTSVINHTTNLNKVSLPHTVRSQPSSTDPLVTTNTGEVPSISTEPLINMGDTGNNAQDDEGRNVTKSEPAAAGTEDSQEGTPSCLASSGVSGGCIVQ